jgi:DNA-binding transcriptional LysR family regulator
MLAWSSLQRGKVGLSLEMVSSSRPVNLKKGEADLAIRSGPDVDEDTWSRAGSAKRAGRFMRRRPTCRAGQHWPT